MNLKFTRLNPKSTQNKPSLPTLFPSNGAFEAKHKLRTLLKNSIEVPPKKKSHKETIKRNRVKLRKGKHRLGAQQPLPGRLPGGWQPLVCCPYSSTMVVMRAIGPVNHAAFSSSFGSSPFSVVLARFHLLSTKANKTSQNLVDYIIKRVKN